MKNKQIKSYLKLLVKLTLTVGSLIFIFKKIDFNEFVQTISNVKIYYYLLAFFAFNISKIISAFRLHNFYKAINLRLTSLYNLKLYYVGMFYNLFLPGAIGGDGYKVYLLAQNTEVKTKYIISATLLDRISGVFFLFLLACLFLIFSTFAPPFPHFDWWIVFAMIISIPAYYFGYVLVFPVFKRVFWSTSHLSFWVQAGQVVCAVFLLRALSVESHYMDYLTLFMVSSVVAVIPLTIGGVGARELVFIYGYEFLNIEKATSIAFTLLFFSVTAITALIGLFYSFKIDTDQAPLEGKTISNSQQARSAS